MDIKEQVKQYISIVDVASLYVNLKPAGKYLKALCPFHTEKTPSFFVMPERQTFTCYGCNRFGDIFTLVQEMERLEFRQAMDFLVDRFHVPVTTKRTAEAPKDEYFHITRVAMKYYRENLLRGEAGTVARDYLQRRGVRPETIETFGLGFASNSWDGLTLHLQKEQGSPDKAVELGLLVRSEKNRIYDRFRGRIIFPILSETGVPLAFGGRTIVDDEAKYLNSPESPIYKKGHHLFGFWLAKDAIRQKRAVVLVEGYMDMIMLHQAGVTHAVASLGTALTEAQTYLLKRFAEEVYLFFDSDAAGLSATLRALERTFEQGINPRILRDPEVKDPDEFIQKKGGEAFAALCQGASDGFRFLLSNASTAFDLARPEKKRQAIETVMTVIRRTGDPILKDEYIQRTAEFFRVDPGLLKAAPAPYSVASLDQKPLRIGTDEREFLLAVMAFPRVLEGIGEFLGDDLLAVLASQSIVRAMLQEYRRTSALTLDAVASACGEAERLLLSRLFVAPGSASDYESAVKTVESCMMNFIKKVNRRKASRFTQEIAVLERDNKLEQAKKLLHEKIHLLRRQSNL